VVSAWWVSPCADGLVPGGYQVPKAAVDLPAALNRERRRVRSQWRLQAGWLVLVASVIALPLIVAMIPPRIFLPPVAPSERPIQGEVAAGPARIAVSNIPANGIDHPAVRRVFAVTRPMRYGDFVWNDAGVPEGERWILIDVTSQVLSAFRAGQEIGTAVIVYGAVSKETPLGRFPILAKHREHRSSLYDADMPYTMRLTGDGVSIHASDVVRGAATHGCIGIPPKFAKALFEEYTKGDMVVIIR
jgi:hypothetical protein